MARVVFPGLLAVVVLSPLPFGSTLPWAWSLLSAVLGGLLVLWGAGAVSGRLPVAVPLRRVWPAAVAFLAVVGWAVVQAAVPAAAPVPALVATDVTGGAALSLNPFDTHTAAMRLLAYGATFWLALQVCRDRTRARQAVLAIAAAGVAYAVYGIVSHSFGSEQILWFDKTLNRGQLTSTFVVRNSYATYAGLGLLCAAAVLVLGVAREIDDAAAGPRRGRTVALHLLTGRSRFYMAAVAAISIALVLTASRAGILATGLGLAVLLAGLVAAGVARRGLLLAAALLCAAIAVYALSISGEEFLGRLVQVDIAREGRLDIYGVTAAALSDAPWTGTGHGTFAEVFHVYQDDRVPRFYTRAHSTYLETAMELGLPAAAVLALAVAGLGALCVAGVFRRRRDAVYPCVGAAATVLVGTHAAVDYSLQIPAVSITYAALLGLATAQAWRSDIGDGPNAAAASP